MTVTQFVTDVSIHYGVRNVKIAETLIDKATEICGGSQAEVARRIGVAPARITEWKTGATKLSPEDAALLADLAHVDIEQAMKDAAIEKHAGTRKGDLLREVLGKALAGFAAVTLGFFCSVGATDATARDSRNIERTDSSHIILRLRAWLARQVKVFRARCLRAWTPAPRPWTA